VKELTTTENIEDNQSITELLKQIAELKNRVQTQKSEQLARLKDEATALQTQIAEVMAKQNEIIQTLKALEVTPEELAGFPPEIVSVFTKSGRKGRASVIFHGEPVSAAEACRRLNIYVGQQNAKIPLRKYITEHPSEDIQIL